MTDKYKARPTTYKGHKMRSRLEAGFAQWLDQATAFDWEYEPGAFASDRWGQYLPDFRLNNAQICGSIRTVYVEVKPDPFFDTWPGDWDSKPYDEALDDKYSEVDERVRRPVFDSMCAIYDSEPDAVLVVAGPGHLELLWSDLPYQDERWSAWPIEVEWSYDWTTVEPYLVPKVAGICDPAKRQYGPWHGEWWKRGPH